jgi:hypothetical protein
VYGLVAIAFPDLATADRVRAELILKEALS